MPPYRVDLNTHTHTHTHTHSLTHTHTCSHTHASPPYRVDLLAANDLDHEGLLQKLKLLRHDDVPVVVLPVRRMIRSVKG